MHSSKKKKQASQVLPDVPWAKDWGKHQVNRSFVLTKHIMPRNLTGMCVAGK